ncbi:hypothetical protein AG1IA_04838 [Rhizoctonia solani AG-1 IA]|uniref:Uncharacterized protein n=1 Tax=Thanatephorus cucumeris (strain AG1-IA) TaxID=983506 RepID=L8WT28_THACA|nr:hypothetical protein AG1IA_04838 [Rhizoctonia solani AG-1 IA]
MDLPRTADFINESSQKQRPNERLKFQIRGSTGSPRLALGAARLFLIIHCTSSCSSWFPPRSYITHSRHFRHNCIPRAHRLGPYAMSDYIQLVPSILVESRHGGHRMPVVISGRLRGLLLEHDLSQKPHEVSNLATDPRSLNKSFAGFRDVLDPVRGVALLITNKYEGRNWPDDFKHSMSLKGAVKDSIHIRQFLEKFGPTMGVNAQAIDDEDHIGKAIESYPPLLITPRTWSISPRYGYMCVYFNYPGVYTILKPPLDVASDGRETETLEGLTAKSAYALFADYYRLLLFRQCVWWVLPMVLAETDLSGLSGLKFVLNLGQDGSASWHKTDECQWGEEILHIAGSLREEQVYETRNAGGYLTEVAEPMSLPQILLHLRYVMPGRLFQFDQTLIKIGSRERVDHHLSIAKEHPKYSGKLKGAKQVPQVSAMISTAYYTGHSDFSPRLSMILKFFPKLASGRMFQFHTDLHCGSLSVVFCIHMPWLYLPYPKSGIVCLQPNPRPSQTCTQSNLGKLQDWMVYWQEGWGPSHRPSIVHEKLEVVWMRSIQLQRKSHSPKPR